MDEILKAGNREYRIVALDAAAAALGIDIRRLPLSLRILLLADLAAMRDAYVLEQIGRNGLSGTSSGTGIRSDGPR